MAEISPFLDHSSADDDNSGTPHADAWKEISRIFGQVNDGSSRPNVPRILYAHPDDDDVDAELAKITSLDSSPGRGADEWVIVQLGPGTYSASNFKFDGFDRVIVRGVGDATVIACSEAAQGSAPNFWPNSLNFSDNTNCGLENMRIVFTDGGTQNAVAQSAIARASNNPCYRCWFKNLTIEVGEMDASRTTNAATIFGIGYIPCDGTTGEYAFQVRDCTIISSCGGVVPGDGEWHFSGCNVWYGNTARTNTPNLIGMDIQRAGRVYWQGGKITTGYNAADPSTDAAVIGIRANQSTSGGRLHCWDATIFARNEAASVGVVKAVYFDDASSATTWGRFWNCYLQAERLTPTYEDEEAVQSSWDPTVDSTGQCQIELNGCRVAGIQGNITGNDGVVTVTAAATIQSNTRGNWFGNTTSGAFTLTLHGNEPVNSDELYIKNIGTGGNDLTVAVGTGDYLDGTENGSIAIPDGGAIRLKCRQLSANDIYWEVMSTNYVTRTETYSWALDGDISDATPVAPGFHVSVGANETLSIIKVTGHLLSGTSVVCQLQDDGTNITDATATATTSGASSSAIDVAVADGSLIELDTSSGSGTPNGLTCTAVFKRTTVMQGA